MIVKTKYNFTQKNKSEFTVLAPLSHVDDFGDYVRVKISDSKKRIKRHGRRLKLVHCISCQPTLKANAVVFYSQMRQQRMDHTYNIRRTAMPRT